MNANTEITEPITIISMVHNRSLQIGLLDIMGPELWHVWMIRAFGALSKYVEPQEYEEFLKRLSFILSQRVKTGVW